jgi:hypothetical protein
MKKNIIDTMRLIEALKNKELIGAETGEGAPLEIGAIEYQRITRTALEDLDALYYEGNYKTDHIGDEIEQLTKLKERLKNIDYRKKLINDHEIMLGKMRAEQKQ